MTPSVSHSSLLIPVLDQIFTPTPPCPLPVVELAQTPFMERLRGIDQSGPAHYFDGVPSYSRFDHSLGVAKIVQFWGGQQEEIIAAFFHDASHIAGSHAGCYLAGKIDQEKSYQDTVHMKILEQANLTPLLEKHGFCLRDLDTENPSYDRLESSLPNLCGDRIEYIAHTGLLLEKITPQTSLAIFRDLNFTEERKWHFTSLSAALSFSRLSCEFTQTFWGTPKNYFQNHLFAQILKRGIELQLFTLNDLHFKTDQEVLKILREDKDSTITHLLGCYSDQNRYFTLVDKEAATDYYQPKFRGVDPWVKEGSKYTRLTELDSNYRQTFYTLKDRCKQGFSIKIDLTA